jgi:hypothetical protein
MTFQLVVDALTHDGPADVARAGGTALCGLAPIIPSQVIAPQAVSGIIYLLKQESLTSIPNPHLTTKEPPLMPYAQSDVRNIGSAMFTAQKTRNALTAGEPHSRK